MTDTDDFDIHATLKKPNQLWAEHLDNEKLPAVVDGIIETIEHLNVNECVFLLPHQFGYNDFAPIAGEHLAELAAINSKKNEAVKNQQYEIAAWSRDREKVIIDKILSAKFGNDRFMLIDETQKKILFIRTNKNIDSLVPDDRKRFLKDYLLLKTGKPKTE